MTQPRSFDDQDCERQEIHRMGAIQAHGVLLVFHPGDGRISHCSDNTGMLLGLRAEKVLGERVENFVGQEPWAKIRDSVEYMQNSSRTSLELEDFRKDGKTWEVFLFRTRGGGFGLEFEERPPGSQSFISIEADDLIREVPQLDDALIAAKRLAQFVRRAAGFERVMIYRFSPDWSGHVIAEDKIAEVHSFMNHYFPAGDIPKPARDLYLLNRTRAIPDASKEPVALLADEDLDEPLEVDLSHSKLRAVPSVHLDYMKNMGVGASFSIAMIGPEGLWGLIACHHREPLRVSLHVRKACERVAAAFTGAIFLLEKEAEFQRKIEFEQGLRQLIRDISQKKDTRDQFFREYSRLCQLFRCQGVAFVSGREVDMAGLTPLREQILEIANWIAQEKIENPKEAFSTTNLKLLNEKWEDLQSVAAGVMLVPLRGIQDSFLLFFRSEVLRQIKWGGEPKKVLRSREYPGRFNPRESFDTWTQTLAGQSEAWTAQEKAGAVHLRDLVFDTLYRQQLLLQELGAKKFD